MYISWQQYLLGIAAIAAIYYVVILIRYYREDVMAFINIHSQAQKVTTHSDDYPSILGAAQPEMGSSYIESESLEFPDSPESSDNFSDDLMSEAESLVAAFDDVDNKEEFLSLLAILISRHKPDDTGLMRIREYLLEVGSRLPFVLTAELDKVLENKS